MSQQATPSPVSSSSDSSSNSTSSPVAVSSKLDASINHLAVYGSLRDDDDSGAAWTKEFIAGINPAVHGIVEGATMYWDHRSLNYPYAILDESANSKFAQSEATTSSPSPSALRVRVLSWPTRAEFEAKIVAGDLIEGYYPENEANSEYVRRAVDVLVKDEAAGGSQKFIRAWIYVMGQSRSSPQPSWLKLHHGDWMQRDRSLAPKAY